VLLPSVVRILFESVNKAVLFIACEFRHFNSSIESVTSTLSILWNQELRAVYALTSMKLRVTDPVAWKPVSKDDEAECRLLG
jgi:HKD family nuclease